jgi:N-methylhydantoinase B
MALQASRTWQSDKFDPIIFEVLRNAFAAVCNEMALVVAKTAYSTPVNEGRDFSGTVYDAEGGQVSQGEFDLPAFVGVTQITVPEVMNHIGPENIKPGDIYMQNDPYIAGTHCNDVHLVKPIFLNGQRIAFIASSAHWSDVGGSVPGTLNCRALECYEEGVRIPPVVIYRDGEFNRDVLTILWANMRGSGERQGDLNAQVAALRAGEARILTLVEKYGLETVQACMAEVQAYAERLLRSHIAELEDGVYDAEDKVDQDLVTGEPKTVRLKLIIDSNQAIFDLTDSDNKALCGINCTRAATTSAICIGIKSLFPDVPMNIGIRRAIDIRMVPGSLVWAQPPSAVSGLAATTMECVVACTEMALGQALPERACGCPYSIMNSVYAGFDPRPGFKNHFINYVWGFGGLGACATHDGPGVVGSPYTASTQNIPCELQERRYPVLWLRYMFKQDSGGPGKFRGGLGCDQLLTFPYTHGTLSCIGDRERFGPPGVFSGEPGRKAGLIVNHGRENERNIGIFAANEPVKTDEIVHYWSAGGGSYGDPLERNPELVLDDVMNEYVSPDGAREDYGVVIKVIDKRRLAYEIDEEATAVLRAKKQRQREAPPIQPSR